MPGRDLDLLIDAARDAGKIARKFFQANPETWEKDGGAGPVTEADLAVDRMLRNELLAARPDFGWLSEETEDTDARLDRDRVFIVDPIDGTRAFVEGSRTWAHSLAIAEQGRVVAGVVYLPMHDKLYAAELGQGARLNDEALRISEADIDGATVLANKWNLDPKHWAAGPPPVERHFRSSLAYRMALVAEGRFDAMMTLRSSWEWDIAAGDLLIREAGGQVTDRKGGALRFNNPHPQTDGVVAAGTRVHRGLTQALA